MRSQIIFLVCFIFAAVITAAAQSVSVTNASLETYKQDRLKNEREYRENYERLGLPSPEEIDRRREQSRIEIGQLSAKLREESLYSERIKAQWRANSRLAVPHYTDINIVNLGWYYPNYFWFYGRRPNLPIVHPHFHPGFYPGGQFWPTGLRTTNAPIRHGNGPGFWTGPRR